MCFSRLVAEEVAAHVAYQNRKRPVGLGSRYRSANPSRQRLAPGRLVAWMADAVINRHLGDIEWVDAIEAPNVEAVLLGVGPSLVMGVDTARRAKEMLRGVRVELIATKVVQTRGNSQSARRHSGDDCPAPSAHRTVAMPGVNESLRKVDIEPHLSAVTRTRVSSVEFHSRPHPSRSNRIRSTSSTVTLSLCRS